MGVKLGESWDVSLGVKRGESLSSMTNNPHLERRRRNTDAVWISIGVVSRANITTSDEAGISHGLHLAFLPQLDIQILTQLAQSFRRDGGVAEPTKLSPLANTSKVVIRAGLLAEIMGVWAHVSLGTGTNLFKIADTTRLPARFPLDR